MIGFTGLHRDEAQLRDVETVEGTFQVIFAMQKDTSLWLELCTPKVPLNAASPSGPELNKAVQHSRTKPMK